MGSYLGDSLMRPLWPALAITALWCRPSIAAPPENPKRERADVPPLFAAIPRLGLVAYGAGDQHLQCSGNCAGFAGTKTPYTHDPAFTLGIDALFAPIPQLRAGVTWQYTLVNEVAIPDRSGFEVGNDWSADAVVEGFFPFAGRWALAPRLQGGVIVLEPLGDLQKYISGLRDEFCPILGDGCTIPDGARVGWNLGGGAGVSFRAHDHVRVRFDATVQYYAFTLYTVSASLLGQHIEAYETLAGARLFLTLGAELY